MFTRSQPLQSFYDLVGNDFFVCQMPKVPQSIFACCLFFKWLSVTMRGWLYPFLIVSHIPVNYDTSLIRQSFGGSAGVLFSPISGILARFWAGIRAWAAGAIPCRVNQKYPKSPCRVDQNPLVQKSPKWLILFLQIALSMLVKLFNTIWSSLHGENDVTFSSPIILD